MAAFALENEPYFSRLVRAILATVTNCSSCRSTGFQASGVIHGLEACATKAQVSTVARISRNASLEKSEEATGSLASACATALANPARRRREGRVGGQGIVVPELETQRLLDTKFLARMEQYRTLDSTSDLAKRRAADGENRLPLLIVAEEQTAGRGRGANRWWTGPGSLACSLLLDVERFGIDRAVSPLVALGAALAVVETVVEMVGPRVTALGVGLHWPNDVYVDRRKLAGVLVETLSNRLYVVGLGVNTNNTAADAPQAIRPGLATLLDLTGARQDHTTFLAAWLVRFEKTLGRLGRWPESVAARADSLCLQHGRTLTIQSDSRSTTGVCRGIAADGALLLDTSSGRRKFHSGVVSCG